MTAVERIEFIKKHCDTGRDNLIVVAGAMPDSWEGWELREYIARSFDAYRMTVDHKGKRYKNYHNDIIISGEL